MGVSITVVSKERVLLHIRNAKALGAKRLTKTVSGKDADKRALKLKKEIEDKLKLGQPIEDKSSAVPTLAEYFEDFKKGYMKSLASKTQEGYLNDFDKYIKPQLGRLQLNEITRAQVKAFIDWLKEQTYERKGTHHLSWDSVRGIHSSLRRIFNEAIDDQILQTNPAEKLGKRYRELPKAHDAQPYSQEEAEKFLKVAKELTPFYFPCFAGLIHFGVRIGELVGLRWVDVDFNRRVIHVMKQGKELARTKTGRTRQVEMSDFMFELLTELQIQREEEFDEVPPHVFCSKVGTALDKDNFRFQQFNKILKADGIRKIRLHDLRHTFATLHLQNGAPLQWVSKQLGHSSIKMTVDTYYHYIPDASKGTYANSLPTIPVTSTNNLIIMKIAASE